MNENERDGSRIGENEHMERPKRRKVNIVRDGICRNIIAVLKFIEYQKHVPIDKLTSLCACQL